mmetsp:Transcript_32829/g.53144  ORF Transcript_32829/g.53144 Transcript_32829/m.53144 type:complete len:102 (+) Transcript_32829:614-919(+)
MRAYLSACSRAFADIHALQRKGALHPQAVSDAAQGLTVLLENVVVNVQRMPYLVDALSLRETKGFAVFFKGVSLPEESHLISGIQEVPILQVPVRLMRREY